MDKQEEYLLRKAHADKEHQRLHGRECRVCMLLAKLDREEEDRRFGQPHYGH